VVDNSLDIVLFAVNVPELYADFLRNRQFQEGLDLIHLVSWRAPDEPKQVHPVLQPGPVVAGVGGHEFLHLVVDVVYGIHRVLRILQALGLRGGVDLAFKREGVDEGIVRGLAVVDDAGAFGDVPSVGAHAGLVARLRPSHDEEEAA